MFLREFRGSKGGRFKIKNIEALEGNPTSHHLAGGVPLMSRKAIGGASVSRG
ncbi:MAG: hypothetical protein HGA56_04850 [Chlorobiaceae bacterium]|nr:hypothetical protein [Chlorobiaceae bacterium]